MVNDKNVTYIKEFRKTNSDTDTRLKIRKIFNVGKSRGNDIFNEIFGAQTKKKSSFKINGNNATAEVKGIETVKTLEDLVKYCNIDTSIWECVKFHANVWNNMLQVKGEFKKTKENISKELIEELKREIKAYSPKVPKIHKSFDHNNLLLEIGFNDIHIGRLANDFIDGHGDYDLKIARKLVFDAIYDITAKATKYGKYSKIILWVGGDYLNADNVSGTTSAGTPQTMDSRFPKVFVEGKNILIEVIDYLKQIAPIHVVISVGNHDKNALFHIGEVISAYYHNDENVTIDNEPRMRKYYKFGTNLIFWTHGDSIDFKKLPSIAAGECSDWSNCKVREGHTGHRHHERMIVAEDGATKIRILPTIAGIDQYHSEHGYVNTVRCLQSFVWHEENGLQNIIYSKPVNQ